MPRRFAAHALLDDQLAVVPGGQVERRAQFLAVVSLADSHRRAQIRRLDEDADTVSAASICAMALRGDFSQSARSSVTCFTMGSLAWAKSRFITSLSMPAAEPSTPEPDISDPGQLKESLDGAVLAEGSVEHRKNHVEGLAVQALLLLSELRRSIPVLAPAASECPRAAAWLPA